MPVRHNLEHRTKRVAETVLHPIKGPRDRRGSLVRKDIQKKWKRLRKLNSRFTKKLRIQQQLRADLMELRKAIWEVKQEIIENHRELGK